MNDEGIKQSMPEHLQRCGVPGRIIRGYREPFETRATEAVRAWLASNETTLVLLGGNGCGKSHAAALLLAENKRGYRCFVHAGDPVEIDWRWNGGFFCNVRQDLGDAKASYEHVVAIRRRATETSALVLDEAGAERGDGEEALFSVLADRHAAERRTAITSNLNEQNFRSRYGGRLLSRILGDGRIVNVHGPDLRVGPPPPPPERPAPKLTGADLAAGPDGQP